MIDLLDVSVSFGGNTLFDNLNLKLNSNDRIALVGANGTGKTTFLRLLTEKNRPDSGRIIKRKNLRIGYLPQEFVLIRGKSLFDEVKSSLIDISSIQEKERFLTGELSKPGINKTRHEELLHELGDLNFLKETTDYYGADSRIEKILMGLGFKEEDLDKKVDEFSGGWQMRIEMAKLLLGNNDLIMMDEPTNHLDLNSLQWLVDFLKKFTGALILVSHDKYFLTSLTDKTLEVFNNKISFYRGNFDEYIQFKIQRDIELNLLYKSQQRHIKQTERFIERFRYKNTKAKQVQSRIKQLDKIERIELSKDKKEIIIRFPEPERIPAVLLETKAISKHYDNKWVLRNINFRLEREDKIAFVGPNGTGKTTLAKILAGRIKPDEGEIDFNERYKSAFYAQEVSKDLNLDKDVLSLILDEFESYSPGYIRTLLGSFMFSNDDVFKKVKILSGGEKSRVALVRMLMTKSNVLILDEPTNHLDYESKLVLQNALINFSGAIIFVSHDIDFIRPIANKIVEISEGQIKSFSGDIEYYFRKKTEELQNDDDRSENSRTPAVTGKKYQKREEALLRQEKFNKTKHLRIKINKLEKDIQKLEAEKLELEIWIADPENYKKSKFSTDKLNRYNDLKVELENSYDEWSILSEELEIIQSLFE